MYVCLSVGPSVCLSVCPLVYLLTLIILYELYEIENLYFMNCESQSCHRRKPRIKCTLLWKERKSYISAVASDSEAVYIRMRSRLKRAVELTVPVGIIVLHKHIMSRNGYHWKSFHMTNSKKKSHLRLRQLLIFTRSLGAWFEIYFHPI